MSNMGTKVRQFVNVVTESYSGALCSLRRIKASDLFYGSTEEALLAEQEAKDDVTAVVTRSRLPKPRIKFDTPGPVDAGMDFLPFYGTTSQSSSKILCMHAAGQAVLYDAGTGTATVETLPGLHEQKGNSPIALSVPRHGGAHDPARPDALYVMDTIRGSFEVLVYGDPTPPSPYKYNLARCPDLFVWHWLRLPPLPRGRIRSYALLDGDTICVSSGDPDDLGTYFFNTAREEWTKAGSWTLPFHGRAHVVPELDNLCFGIQDIRTHRLCAVDLSSSMDGPPKEQHIWPDMHKPVGWRLEKASMTYMGAGRFCISKTFDILDRNSGDLAVDVANVLNGVELLRREGGELRMMRHRSVRYGLFGHCIRCVL